MGNHLPHHWIANLSLASAGQWAVMGERLNKEGSKHKELMGSSCALCYGYSRGQLAAAWILSKFNPDVKTVVQSLMVLGLLEDSHGSE